MHYYLILRMARAMTVPSLGIATKQYLASLDDVRKSRMSGWGTVEWIGVAGCITIVVPFVRRKKHTPATFWMTPDLPPATAALSHSQLRQVPTPLVTEVRQPRAPRKKATGTPASTAKNKKKSAQKRKPRKSQRVVSSSSSSSSSDSEVYTDMDSDDQPIVISSQRSGKTKTWHCGYTSQCGKYAGCGRPVRNCGSYSRRVGIHS